MHNVVYLSVVRRIKAKESLRDPKPKPQPDKKQQDSKFQKPFRETVPYRPQVNIFYKKQETALLNHLIRYLEKNELLPAIMFIFSRAQCDEYARTLSNIDLTTHIEKKCIGKFFNKCIATLKEPDRTIPQITNIRDVLVRGIGVHHSGILHIIKEIVEMLFQIGLLKVCTFCCISGWVRLG